VQSGCAQVGRDVGVQEAWCTVYHILTLHSLVSGSVYKNVRIKSAMNYLFNKQIHFYCSVFCCIFCHRKFSFILALHYVFCAQQKHLCNQLLCSWNSVPGCEKASVHHLVWCLWRHKLYIDFFMYTVKILIKFYITKLSQYNDQTTG